jgi:hypothetical protein
MLVSFRDRPSVPSCREVYWQPARGLGVSDPLSRLGRALYSMAGAVWAQASSPSQQPHCPTTCRETTMEPRGGILAYRPDSAPPALVPQAVDALVREIPTTCLVLLDLRDPPRYPLTQEVKGDTAFSCEQLVTALIDEGPEVPAALYPHRRVLRLHVRRPNPRLEGFVFAANGRVASCLRPTSMSGFSMERNRCCRSAQKGLSQSELNKSELNFMDACAYPLTHAPDLSRSC